MSDITKCATPCERKDTCYRHMAQSHPYWQSWQWFLGSSNCDGYIKFQSTASPEELK